MTEQLLQLTKIPRAPVGAERSKLEQRARLLAHGGNVWHVFEFAVAVGAGVAAGSIALIGFGADSLVEVLAGSVIVWLFTSGRGSSADAERHAQRIIAVSFLVLAAYVAIESTRDLAYGHRPSASWIGIALAAITAPTMPLLARAKRRLGNALGSSATVSEARQNQLCAYLSVALLTGLLLNAVWGLWWADPAAALVIASVALKEARDSWRGDRCDCC